MLNYLPVAKLSMQFVASLGVSKIVGDIVKNNVDVATTVQAVTVKAGSLVLSSIIIEQSSNHIERVANKVTAELEKRRADKDSE
jgi:hypothetical protein